MKISPISNFRWALLLLASLSVLALIVFVDRRLLPRVIPTGTPAATLVSTLMPTAAGQGAQSTYINSTKLGVHSALKLNLPAPWQVIDLDAEHLNRLLGKLKEKASAPPVADAVETLLTAVDPGSTALVALLLDAQATNQEALPPSVTIIVVPRNGLSLSRYLADVGADLSRHTGITIQESKIDNTLRFTNLPVAMLHYTWAANSMSSVSMAVDGYQIAAFDAQAANIIVFTFTTPSPRYIELLPMFQEIVRSAQLN
jgi:hypothetical protein